MILDIQKWLTYLILRTYKNMNRTNVGQINKIIFDEKEVMVLLDI